MQTIETNRRQGDKFIRKMAISIAVGFILQVIACALAYGTLIGQVDMNTQASMRADRTRIILAERHFTKMEVLSLVDRATKPIHDKLDPMRKDLRYLVREKRK